MPLLPSGKSLAINARKRVDLFSELHFFRVRAWFSFSTAAGLQRAFVTQPTCGENIVWRLILPYISLLSLS